MQNSIEVVMRDHDFVLYKNGKHLLTPNGNKIAHSNGRLLRQAITQQSLIQTASTSSMKLLEALIDQTYLVSDLKLENDPIIFPTYGNNESILDYPELLTFILQNSSSLHSAYNNFISKKEVEQTTIDFISEEINKLSDEQKVVFNQLRLDYHQGSVLHLMVCRKVLSASEYASSIIVQQLKSNDPLLINELKNNGINAISKKHIEISNSAHLALDFLTLFKNRNKLSVIEEIITRGEDSNTEFKSTLRWDIYQSKKNPAIEHAALKTICAFLNSEGGDLLIGVRDDGSIEGFETDKFPNEDRFLLHLWTLIKTCLGQEVVEWVKTSTQQFGDKTVCRVSCLKGAKPTFLKQKGFDEAFYVRVGPSSSALDISAALSYVKEHFDSN